MSTTESDALLGPADIRALATELGVRPTKQRGQNFVIDANTVRRIVRTAEVRLDDVVVEVGPGLGSLTLALLEVADRVTAIEIDDVLAAALPATIEARMPERAGRFALVHGDATQVTGLPGPRSDGTGRQPSVQRRRSGAAPHAGALPEHRTYSDHGPVRGRRPAGSGTGQQGVRSPVREGQLVRRREAGRSHRPHRLLARAQCGLRPRLTGAPHRPGDGPPRRAPRSSRSSTPPSPSAARPCGPRSPAGRGPRRPPRRR